MKTWIKAIDWQTKTAVQKGVIVASDPRQNCDPWAGKALAKEAVAATSIAVDKPEPDAWRYYRSNKDKEYYQNKNRKEGTKIQACDNTEDTDALNIKEKDKCVNSKSTTSVHCAGR